MENTENFSSTNEMEIPKNNMGLSILGTVLGICSPICCLIGMSLGIIAIVNSSKVKKQFDEGNYEAAEKAAKNAKLFATIAIALGILGMIISAFTWDTQMEQLREALEKAGIEYNF